jgi:heptosyltransferase-2
MIGSAADASTTADVARAFQARHPSDRARAFTTDGARAFQASDDARLHDLVGRTTLPALAGVLTRCRALVTNDSGAMHLAAAAGVAVTAVFGPTNERATRPAGDAHVVLTHPVWCRPCMLRECPIDHRCMRGVGVAAVLDAARRTL